MNNAMTAHQTNTLLSVANTYGTPCYVYDKNTILANYHAYCDAFNAIDHQICYAVKANANLHILKLLADAGAGFDIVSAGELQRVIMAGGDPQKTIFSGVGKQLEEIIMALEIGIEAFDIESLAELDTIIGAAQATEIVAPISIRFNPNVDAKTHPYISTGLKENKFGLTAEQALQAYQRAMKSEWIEIVGINMHIGSQITDLTVFSDALKEQAKFIEQLQSELGLQLKHINIGGGVGVCYDNETPFDLTEYAKAVKAVYANQNARLILEPGRSIVANAGFLLTEVLYKKSHDGQHFTIVDAAMNDYMRVALYQAHNHITNLTQATEQAAEQSQQIDDKRTLQSQSIVGPVCESADFFAKSREIATQAGDILAIQDVGAYGFAMASNYNARMRPPEVLIDHDEFTLIRQRETFEELIANELIGDLALESALESELE